MNMIAHRQLPPTPEEALMARLSREALKHVVHERQPLTVRMADAQPEQSINLPAGAVALLINILEAMAEGKGFTLIPESAELTTVQAAGVLNVSRPFLIRLLEEGAIPHRKVGKHRRVRMDDVMAYKQRIDADREAALDALTAEAQAHGMGYSR